MNERIIRIGRTVGELNRKPSFMGTGTNGGVVDVGKSGGWWRETLCKSNMLEVQYEWERKQKKNKVTW